MRYLSKVYLINSANVKFAEISIDGNVHFIGTQGVGKSTLLRAILFFYNADKLKLGIEKGKKTFDEYYFPFGNSYVIYEVERETGPFCVMAFKAQGRVCFRFINSAFKQEHFISPEGKVKAWDGIKDSLGKSIAHTRKVDRYEEYRDILYGNNIGVDKEFRKYALVESRQYQNIPRTIQNVFLNSKLDAEFIKQTIIMSLNEEDVKIGLEKYILHLRDFDTHLADINKWTEVNKSGEIPVRKMSENIARAYAAIQSLNREKQETAIQLFHAYDAALVELPQATRRQEHLQKQKQTLLEKLADLKGKFQNRKEDIQKGINILDNELKKAKARAEYYEGIDINSIIQRVARKEDNEAERERLMAERALLNAKFTEINSRYEALIQQQQNALAVIQNQQSTHRNKLREDLLVFKSEVNEQYTIAFADIRTQHQAALEVARNVIAQKKDNIHELRLKRQKVQLQRFFEEEIDNTKTEIANLNQKIKVTSVDIADHKKQAETLQKQWELELERNNATYDRRIDKMHDDAKVLKAQIEAIDAKLQKNKDSLYGWLNEHVPGWEQTIGKVLDEDTVLFQHGLSPVMDAATDTIYGLRLDLTEITKSVKTVAEYQAERQEWQQKADTNWNNVRALTDERNAEAEKLKTRFQNRIKDLNNTRRQLDYELQRAKGQLEVNEVRLADYTRKAAEEKEKQLKDIDTEMQGAGDELLAEEKNMQEIEAGIQRQLDNKEKERNKKIKTEEQRIKELMTILDDELADRKRETEDRIAEIKQQQTMNLSAEGADVFRLNGIERELTAVARELEYINENRDKVAEFNKDKRELFDLVDNFKTEKKLKENQLENEHEKYKIQEQKLQLEVESTNSALTTLNSRLAILREGVNMFNSFKQTDHYREVAEFEGQKQSGGDNGIGLKEHIESLNGKIYTIQQRYNDLQTAINKFLGHFESNNIFGFKTNLVERKEFLDFAEMLHEFLEEDKIAQYEKRVNERFATLIRQIGKETTELTSKGGEIQKVITEINRDFEERNFAGVIKSIRLQLTDSQNKIVALLQEIKKFNDNHSMSIGVVDLFSQGDNEAQNRKAVSLLKEFAREINARKEKEISLPDSFELQFRIVENENDSGWVEKLTNVGSEGTDILVKAMINIMLLNVFKDSASKRFKDFRLHCMMDEIGKLHPNNVKGILKFANDRNILLINSSPTSFNATDYKYTYLLTKDNKNVTTVKKLIRKGAEA